MTLYIIMFFLVNYEQANNTRNLHQNFNKDTYTFNKDTYNVNCMITQFK